MDDYTLNKMLYKRQLRRSLEKNTGKKIQDWFRQTFSPAASSAALLQKWSRTYVKQNSIHKFHKFHSSFRQFDTSLMFVQKAKDIEIRKETQMNEQPSKENTRIKINNLNRKYLKGAKKNFNYPIQNSIDCQRPLIINFNSSQDSLSNSSQISSQSLTEKEIITKSNLGKSSEIPSQLLTDHNKIENSWKIFDKTYNQSLKKNNGIHNIRSQNYYLIEEIQNTHSICEEKYDRLTMEINLDERDEKHIIWMNAFNRSKNIEVRSKHLLEEAQKRKANYRKSLRIFMTKMMRDFLAALIQTWWKTLLQNQDVPNSKKSIVFGQMIRIRVTNLLKDFLRELSAIIIQKWWKRIILQLERRLFICRLRQQQQEKAAHDLWFSAYKATELIEDSLMRLKKKVASENGRIGIKLTKQLEKIKKDFIVLTIQNWWKIFNQLSSTDIICNSYEKHFMYGFLIRFRIRNLFKNTKNMCFSIIVQQWWKNILKKSMDREQKEREKTVIIIQMYCRGFIQRRYIKIMTLYFKLQKVNDSLANFKVDAYKIKTEYELETSTVQPILSSGQEIAEINLDFPVKSFSYHLTTNSNIIFQKELFLIIKFQKFLKVRNQANKIITEHEMPKIIITEEEYPLNYLFENNAMQTESQSLTKRKLIIDSLVPIHNELIKRKVEFIELWKLAIFLIKHLDNLCSMVKENTKFITDGKVAKEIIKVLRKEIIITIFQTKWKMKSKELFSNTLFGNWKKWSAIRKILNFIIKDIHDTISAVIIQRNVRRFFFNLHAELILTKTKLKILNNGKFNTIFLSPMLKYQDKTALETQLISKSSANKYITTGKILRTILMETHCMKSYLKNSLETQNMLSVSYKYQLHLKKLINNIQNEFFALNVQIWWCSKNKKISLSENQFKEKKIKSFFFGSLMRKNLNCLMEETEKKIGIKFIEIWFKSLQLVEKDRRSLITILKRDKNIWMKLSNLLKLHIQGLTFIGRKMTEKFNHC